MATDDFTAECRGGPTDLQRRERVLAAPEADLRRWCRRLLTDLVAEINQVEAAGNVSYLAGVTQVYAEFDALTDTRARVVQGYVGLVVMTAGLLRRRIGNEKGALPDTGERRRVDDQCQALTTNAHVQHAIHAMYRPAASSDKHVRDSWSDLEVASITYRTAGTTSMILEARAAHQAWPVAVKCLLLPWSGIDAITEATSSYAATYGTANSTSDVVVRAYASTRTWVLMPYENYFNLSAHVETFHRPTLPNGDPDFAKYPTMSGIVEETRRISDALITALYRLGRKQPVDGSDERRQHLDLSPNNILVEPVADGEYQMHFIDLGRNHLYTRQIGLAEHDDSVFVSPEVKNRQYRGTSDVYSFGLILIFSLTGRTPSEPHTPEAVWQLSPDLARFVDDLIDREHTLRALLPPIRSETPPAAGSPAAFDYTRLGQAAEGAFARALVEPRDGLRSELARALPNALAPTTLIRKAISTKRLRDTTYLAVASAVAALAWWLAVSLCSVVTLPDLLRGRLPLHDDGETLGALLISFSQAAVAAKYYQSVLASLSARKFPIRVGQLAEPAMRLTTVVAVPTVIVTTYFDVNGWTWTCAIGAIVVATTNLLVLITARRCLRAGAKQFSTVAPGQGVGGGFEQWWWSMMLYGLVLFIIAIGLSTGDLQDRGAYVVGLLIISFGIHYVTKCVIGGPAVRAGLTRAFSVAERLEAADRHGVLTTDVWRTKP